MKHFAHCNSLGARVAVCIDVLEHKDNPCQKGLQKHFGRYTSIVHCSSSKNSTDFEQAVSEHEG